MVRIKVRNLGPATPLMLGLNWQGPNGSGGASLRRAGPDEDASHPIDAIILAAGANISIEWLEPDGKRRKIRFSYHFDEAQGFFDNMRGELSDTGYRPAEKYRIKPLDPWRKDLLRRFPG